MSKTANISPFATFCSIFLLNTYTDNYPNRSIRMSDKWKQLVDLIVNEEEQKASDLFHEIVIENSR